MALRTEYQETGEAQGYSQKT